MATASVTGNWNDTATWGGGAIPGTGNGVIINGGVTVTIPNGYSAACAACTIGATNNLTGRLINNGTLTVDVGSNVKVGNGGTNQDGWFTFGPGSTTTLTTANFIFGNGTVDSTATKANPAKFTGSGAITSLATAKMAVTLSNVSFQNTGAINMALQNTIGLLSASSLSLTNCVFAGTSGITLGATDTANTVPMSITNCDFRNLVGTRIITIRRAASGNATYEFKHNTMIQDHSLNTRSSLLWTTSDGLVIDGNVFINAVLGSSAVRSVTITNNLQTITSAVAAAVVVLSDAVAGSTYQYNYIFSTQDTGTGGANLHPIQTDGSGGSGSHTITYNLLDAFADATNDEPDMFMPGNTTTVLQALFANNMLIYAGELVNGAHSPAFTAGAGILIRNNTMAGTIPAALAIPSGDIYRPEVGANSGTITIRSNLHSGNAVSGEFSIAGGHGSPQTIAYSDYNAIFNVTTPYGEDTGGLTITAGNTTKAAVDPHGLSSSPQFFDSRRDMAVWNGIFGSGTATRAAASTYWESLNGYRGTPNFDQNGTATAYVPRNMLDYVMYGYSPTRLTYRGAGDPTDGSLDIGAMPVRSKTTMFLAA